MDYKEKTEEVIKKLKEYKKDLKDYQEQDITNHTYVSIGMVGMRLNSLLKILEVEDETTKC